MTPMPFIVGSPRSGTTLLRMMLASHSQLAIPPETGFVAYVATHPHLYDLGPDDLLQILVHFPPETPAWSDFGLEEDALRTAFAALPDFTVAEGIRSFYRLYAARHEKTRSGDKTPLHGQAMPAIERLIPEAAFIHIIRDGRDASLSLRGMWFAPGGDIATLATYWRDNVANCRALGGQVRRYIELRYEDLITDADSQLRRLCEFLELPYEPAMLQHQATARLLVSEHQGRVSADGAVILTRERRQAQQWRTTTELDPARIAGWRTGLAPAEQALFWEIAGPLLAQLGYGA